jgi:ribonuclease HI
MIHIYTDGSSKGNPGPGGYGVVLLYNNNRKELCGGFKLTTNSRMELTAAVEGLRAINRPSKVKLFCDSKYVVDSVEKGWLKSWQTNGWRKRDGKPVLNVGLWKQMVELIDTHEVEFTWIKGHADNAENARCDFLATSAAERNDLPADIEYENRD